MPFEELAEDVFAIEARFEDVPMQVYVIKADCVTVIDPGPAGTPEAKLAPGLARLGLGLGDVDLVLNTHGHHDHRGGNGAIRAANPRVRVAAHPGDAEWVSDANVYIAEQYLRYTPAWLPPRGFVERIARMCGEDGPVDHLLSDGEELDLGKGHRLLVRHVPAHTPGSTVFFHQQGKVLFTGDSLQARGTPLWKRPPFFPAYNSLCGYNESLAYFRECGADVVATAHSGICTPHHAAQLVMDSLTLVDELTSWIHRFLQGREQATLVEVADAVWTEWPRYERGAQLFMTVGAHLDDLVANGFADRQADGGAPVYSSLPG